MNAHILWSYSWGCLFEYKTFQNLFFTNMATVLFYFVIHFKDLSELKLAGIIFIEIAFITTAFVCFFNLKLISALITCFPPTNNHGSACNHTQSFQSKKAVRLSYDDCHKPTRNHIQGKQHKHSALGCWVGTEWLAGRRSGGLRLVHQAPLRHAAPPPPHIWALD